MRRHVVLVLAEKKDEWIREQMGLTADRIENGRATTTDVGRVVQVLRAIAAGQCVEKNLGIGNARGGQTRVRIHKWMAIDYRLRQSLGHKKVAANVTHAWRQRSTSTVSGIAAKYKNLSENVVARWTQHADEGKYGLEDYVEAVDRVRRELIDGETTETLLTKWPDETIAVTFDYEEWLMPPPELSTG